MLYLIDSYHIRQEHIQRPFMDVVVAKFSLLLSCCGGCFDELTVVIRILVIFTIQKGNPFTLIYRYM